MKHADTTSAAAIAAAYLTSEAKEGDRLEPVPQQRDKNKPVATIGTMQKHATPDQVRLHHKLKMKLKKEAREARHGQHLREESSQRKE